MSLDLVQPPPETETLQTQLIDWYRSIARELPWRRTTDPYAIWLSEIMLQQTQVATVLPYYDRFLQRFPTIQSLAQAPQDEVLKYWEGLGYYTRARNLHKAAKQIIDDHQGTFPQTFDAVVNLPGIGQSTAGAILTFAFRQPHPILDGNVKRVLARLFAMTDPIDKPQGLKQLWESVTRLLPQNPDQAYDFNQGLMELGASLCSPKQPQCKACPWQFNCQSFHKQLVQQVPVTSPKKKSPHFTIGVGVVWNDNQEVLIALRPEEGLLGGLWEFPGGKVKEHESIIECVQRELLEETGLEVAVQGKIAEVKHAYTHFKITLHAYHCQKIKGQASPKASQALKWVTLDAIDQYAFPKANKVILETLKQQGGSQQLMFSNSDSSL